MAPTAQTICVHCATPAPSVFVLYSPGNIRLCVCNKCGRTVDEYVEYDFLIVVINLILLKPEAYRHVLFNSCATWNTGLHGGLLWSASLLLLVDFSFWQCSTKGHVFRWDTRSPLFTTLRQMLLQVCIPNLQFIWTVALGAEVVSRTTSSYLRLSELLRALLISSYFKVFLVAMLVWEFSPKTSLIIDILTLSANTVALKVMLKTNTCLAMAVVAAAALGRTLVSCAAAKLV